MEHKVKLLWRRLRLKKSKHAPVLNTCYIENAQGILIAFYLRFEWSFAYNYIFLRIFVWFCVSVGFLKNRVFCGSFRGARYPPLLQFATSKPCLLMQKAELWCFRLKGWVWSGVSVPQLHQSSIQNHLSLTQFLKFSPRHGPWHLSQIQVETSLPHVYTCMCPVFTTQKTCTLRWNQKKGDSCRTCIPRIFRMAKREAGWEDKVSIWTT